MRASRQEAAGRRPLKPARAGELGQAIVHPPAASGSAREGVSQKQPRDDQVQRTITVSKARAGAGDQRRASTTEAIVQGRETTPSALWRSPNAAADVWAIAHRHGGRPGVRSRSWSSRSSPNSPSSSSPRPATISSAPRRRRGPPRFRASRPTDLAVEDHAGRLLRQCRRTRRCAGRARRRHRPGRTVCAAPTPRPPRCDDSTALPWRPARSSRRLRHDGSA